MDYLQHSLNAFRAGCRQVSFIPFADLLVSDEDYSNRNVKYPQVDRILALVRKYAGTDPGGME